MLQTLYIKNYALISELNITLHRGFSVITGETGAGKSILLGAIGLLLGQRADTKAIKQGEQRCIIEATFNLRGYGMKAFFADNDLELGADALCIIRRELTATGKSRAFINDSPVQVNVLRQLGDRLIDIHSQHQNLLLGQEGFQLNVVDIIAHDEAERSRYTLLYNRYMETKRKLHEAEQAATRGHDEADYMRFQLSQIEELNIHEGQQEEYEQDAQLLGHAEEIKGALYTAQQAINGDNSHDSTTIEMLRHATRTLQNISDMLPEADALAQRIDSCHIELQDIASELETQAERTDVDPARLQEVNDWLGQLYGLLQKHHLSDETELLAFADNLRTQLETIDNSDKHIQQLQAELQATQTELTTQAAKLTKLRQKGAQLIETEILKRLVPLGIPNARFSVGITPAAQPMSTGMDEIKFLFSANKNSALQDIAAVASGGEIARVMLALKALISASVSLPTIIFDEIDTGVSGHIAESMADTMRQMGEGGRQVIAITHLPQIAALGQHHYRVYKQDSATDTTSHIDELTLDERIKEVAHMLSGNTLIPAAIDNAKALLGIGN